MVSQISREVHLFGSGEYVILHFPECTFLEDNFALNFLISKDHAAMSLPKLASESTVIHPWLVIVEPKEVRAAEVAISPIGIIGCDVFAELGVNIQVESL